ncbi:hypothetical protein JD844_033890, partial [Phrynosoma platyrhinos]
PGEEPEEEQAPARPEGSPPPQQAEEEEGRANLPPPEEEEHLPGEGQAGEQPGDDEPFPPPEPEDVAEERSLRELVSALTRFQEQILERLGVLERQMDQLRIWVQHFQVHRSPPHE